MWQIGDWLSLNYSENWARTKMCAHKVINLRSLNQFILFLLGLFWKKKKKKKCSAEKVEHGWKIYFTSFFHTSLEGLLQCQDIFFFDILSGWSDLITHQRKLKFNSWSLVKKIKKKTGRVTKGLQVRCTIYRSIIGLL